MSVKYLNGYYSGYAYAITECNSGKYLLEKTYRYDDRPKEMFEFDTEAECHEKIHEIESMFDHRSPWD